MATERDDVSSRGPVRLGPLEAQILDALWNGGPASVREIIERLGRGPAYTTIATVLGNMRRKGVVESSRKGRYVQYAATYSREVHAARQMEEALSASDDRAASILHFVEAIEPTDLELLRNYLDGHKDEQ